jgi:hypothetical protein
LSKIWLDGQGAHRLPFCCFWPLWQIAVTIMVFCELFKYMVVAVTPSIFIIGLHLALSQPSPWGFGVGQASDDAQFQGASKVEAADIW